MRILQLTSHLNVGGVTTHVLSIARAFASRGHEVVLASDAGTLQPSADGRIAHWRVPLQTSAELSPRVWWTAAALRRRLREQPVDLIHAHTRVAQVVADRLSAWARVPYVTTWHGFFRRNLGRRLWPCSGAAAIAVSEPVREHLVRDLGIPSSRIRLIPHGVDTSSCQLPADRMARQQLRESVHLPPEARVIGTVARLVPSKAVEQLIEGLAHVRASMPAVHLLIVGDGPERARLQQLAVARALSDAVHFAGTLPDTHLALSLMEVFIFLPAVQEGFGLSLLEAMAAARPVVAIRQGGGSTWVLDRDPVGLLVAPRDPHALASSIVRVLRDPVMASRMAEEARALVAQRYSFERMINAIENVYRDTVRS